VSDLLQAFVDEVTKARTLAIDPADFESGKRILALAPEQQAVLLIELVNLQVVRINSRATGETLHLKALVGALLRRKLPFSGAQLEQLVDSLSTIRRAGWWEVVGAESIVRAVEGVVTSGAAPASLLLALERLAAVLDEQQHEARVRRLSTRVRALIDPRATAKGQPRPLTLGTDEEWTRALGAALDAMNESTRAAWNQYHWPGTESSVPSAFESPSRWRTLPMTQKPVTDTAIDATPVAMMKSVKSGLISTAAVVLAIRTIPAMSHTARSTYQRSVGTM
jgi:hypothetical protein